MLKNAIVAIALCGALAVPAAADTVQYTYDALGRLVQVVYPDGTKITYSYDPAGNRTEVCQGPSC